jgi:hypothetical protein
VISSTGSTEAALVSTPSRLLTVFAYSKRVRRRSGTTGTCGVVVQLVVLGGVVLGGVVGAPGVVPVGAGAPGVVPVGAGAPGVVPVGAGAPGVFGVGEPGVLGSGVDAGPVRPPSTSPVHPTPINSSAATTLEQLLGWRINR